MQAGTFINSTGQSIVQLYQYLFFIIPGKQYPSIPLHHRKQSHSLFVYARRLLTLFLSVQIKHLAALLTFKPVNNLQSRFGQESLAILSNSVDLHQATCKAQQYNIPLLQLVIATPIGQKTVKQKILLNFAVSHLLNQNFVLYGDWQPHNEMTVCIQQKDNLEQTLFSVKQGAYFRRGELVYAFIPLSIIAITHQNILQQNLLRVRNMFYLLQDETGQTIASNLTPQPSSMSSFQMDSEIFPNRQQEDQNIQDNFIDSDGQIQQDIPM